MIRLSTGDASNQCSIAECYGALSQHYNALCCRYVFQYMHRHVHGCVWRHVHENAELDLPTSRSLYQPTLPPLYGAGPEARLGALSSERTHAILKVGRHGPEWQGTMHASNRVPCYLCMKYPNPKKRLLLFAQGVSGCMLC